jgi:hypothetical protein
MTEEGHDGAVLRASPYAWTIAGGYHSTWTSGFSYHSYTIIHDRNWVRGAVLHVTSLYAWTMAGSYHNMGLASPYSYTIIHDRVEFWRRPARPLHFYAWTIAGCPCGIDPAQTVTRIPSLEITQPTNQPTNIGRRV